MIARDRRLTRALAVCVLLALDASVGRAQPGELPAQVVTVGGRAELSRAAAPAWTAAALRNSVGPGDGVRTGSGRLALRTGSGQAIRVGPRTELLFLPADGGQPGTRLRMIRGRVWIAVAPNSPEARHVVVQAGPVTVTALSGGIGVAMNPDGTVSVSVYHGRASATGRGWQRMLVQDQAVVVPPGGPPAGVTGVKREERDLSWIRWNEQQDRAGGFGARADK